MSAGGHRAGEGAAETGGSVGGGGRVRSPAVAGMFYPDDPADLRALVDELLGSAAAEADAGAAIPAAPAGAAIPAAPAGAEAGALRPAAPGGALPPATPAGALGDVSAAREPAGILVPHAGLVYSGLVAAAAWRLLAPKPRAATAADAASSSPTIVLLGTNHGAGWLTGVGAWDGGPWRTPLGDVEVDGDLTAAVVALGAPFARDGRCHLGEHSLEVQLPFVRRVAPGARIVALSVGTGRGRRAIDAGERLGGLLAERRAAGAPILLAISTDMAHYPPAAVAERVTAALLPHILALDPEGLGSAESAVALAGERGVSCGMCGIEPSVLGLAALRVMAADPGVILAAATSADAGGDPRRTVGYLAVAFPGA